MSDAKDSVKSSVMDKALLASTSYNVPANNYNQAGYTWNKYSMNREAKNASSE